MYADKETQKHLFFDIVDSFFEDDGLSTHPHPVGVIHDFIKELCENFSDGKNTYPEDVRNLRFTREQLFGYFHSAVDILSDEIESPEYPKAVDNVSD